MLGRAGGPVDGDVIRYCINSSAWGLSPPGPNRYRDWICYWESLLDSLLEAYSLL